jgi:hypothetical protein
MPKSLAAQVTAMVDHRAAPPPTGTTRGSQLTQLAQMIDPTYDATAYKTKQGIETAFTSGRPATVLKSLNVVQDHLDVFRDVSKNLGNNNAQFINAMGNKIAQWSGKPAPTDFNAVKGVLADELTKAILGTPGALGDRQEMQNNINSSNSPVQLAGVVNKWQKLISGQVKGMKDQYESGGGTNKAGKALFERVAASSATSAAPAVTIKNDSDYNNLPSGTLFTGPDNIQRRKP